MKRFQMLDAQAGVRYGGVDFKEESISEKTTKWCACHWEIHTSMKLVLKSINRFSWTLEEVGDVGWVMVSWTKASKSYI